jgi:hypothetical protein
MLKLSGGEIDDHARRISEYLEDVPIYYITEVLEIAREGREREGDIDGVDTTSSDEEDNKSSSDDESDSDDEDNESNSDSDSD